MILVLETSSHQGQDFHLDVNGNNLLEVSIPRWLGESKDIGHYNAFGQFLVETLSSSGFAILNGVDKQCQSFDCFFNMGGLSVVDNLIRDPDSLHNCIFSSSTSNKPANSNHYAFFFKMCHSVGMRLRTSYSKSQVICPNHKKANRYTLNVKHELTYMQGKSYTSLDEHTQT